MAPLNVVKCDRGQQRCALAVAGTTRQCLDIAVGRGLTGYDVVGTLERLRFDRGLPQRIYCDNSSEFVGAAMELWAYTSKVILDFRVAASRRTMRPSNPSTAASAMNV